MNKYRYTITFETDDDFAENGEDEQLKKELIDVTEDHYCENLKVIYEDDECVRNNDKLHKKQVKCWNTYKDFELKHDEVNLTDIWDGSGD